jgi:hypothetical protein
VAGQNLGGPLPPLPAGLHAARLDCNGAIRKTKATQPLATEPTGPIGGVFGAG